MRTWLPKNPMLDLRLVVGLAAALTLLSCSKDSSPSGPGLTLADKDYLAQGWRQFEAQHYDSAGASFTSAYTLASTQAMRAEALSGRGWTSMYKRDLSGAKTDFSTALNTTGITASVLNDARAGGAFTLYALNMYSDAASNANAALTDNPSYVFAHDAKVTAKRLRLLLVQSYYANGQFTLAAAQLDIFDPTRSPHSADPTVLLGAITAALNSL
jgi:tetratricopeptide (TPR) repeat protein